MDIGFSNPIQKLRRAAQVLGSKGIKAIRQMAGHVFLREFAMEKTRPETHQNRRWNLIWIYGWSSPKMDKHGIYTIYTIYMYVYL